MKEIFIILFQFYFISAENLITFSEFRKAFTDNVYPTPSREQYDTIMSMAQTAGNITTKRELAMFLAQVLWESAGLQHKKEIKCASNGCPSSYRTGREQPGKYYYGRGYIQLTWLYNYEQCSQDLYKDNRLVEDPDIVSDTEEGAWGSAFWYWGRHCHVWPGVKEGLFGASTMAINGALECKGPYKVKAFKRFTIYVRVLKAFKLFDVKPIQDGCYPMTGPESSDFRLCDAVGAHKNGVGMYHWCNDNCNAEDPNCPQDMCECEGGNPVKKVKASNESLTETLTSSPPKILSIPQQSLQPRNPVRVFAKTQTHRRPEPRPTTESEPRPVFRHESTPSLRPDPTPAPQSDPTPDLRYRSNSRPHYRPEPTPDPDVGQPLDESEHSIFRYHEPKRSTTPIPDLIDNTTLKPEVSRTRLLRNELGRLVRKRPVIRTTTTEEPPLENNHQMFDSMKNQ